MSLSQQLPPMKVVTPEIFSSVITPAYKDEENTDVVGKRGKETVISVRDRGKSLFPVSRVQKIIKVDKELPAIAKEAVIVISIATEEFIKRLGEASQKQAEREKRTTVQRRDIAAVVRRADEFLFLDEIIPWEEAEPVTRPRKKVAALKFRGNGTES